jgi:hypothetical protein
LPNLNNTNVFSSLSIWNITNTSLVNQGANNGDFIINWHSSNGASLTSSSSGYNSSANWTSPSDSYYCPSTITGQPAISFKNNIGKYFCMKRIDGTIYSVYIVSQSTMNWTNSITWTNIPCTSGTPTLANITLGTPKSVLFFLNDTVGNTNTTVFSWDYKVFENSQTYVNSTYANVNNPFTLNITSPNVSSVILNYNNTNYTANSYVSGSNYISSISVTSPLVNQDTNITFSWLVTLLDGSVVQTNLKNQTIVYLTIGNNYSNLIYNFSFKDEATNAIINNSLVTTSYEVIYGFNNLSILGTKYFSGANLTNVNISSNIASSLYLSGNIIYSATGYIGRTYTFLEDSINTSKNVTLYLSNSNTSYAKTILVTDEAGRGQPALFKQYSIIAGVKTLVASEQLDNTGKSTIVFTPNIQYYLAFFII